MPSYEEDLSEFERRNAQVLGISTDQVFSMEAWAKSMGGLSYPLLCDFWPHGAVAQKYGLFREENGFSERANVIIDPKQTVAWVKVYPVHSVPDIREILAFLRNGR